MDADFSHDPRYLPDFLKAIEYADLVIGSRYIPGGDTPNCSFVRRLISSGGNIFARFMLGIPVHDCTGGFRCYRREVLRSIDLDAIQSRGYAFQVELTYRVIKQGFKIVEIPITFMDRRPGKSKMSRKIVIEAFTYVLRTRLSKQSHVGLSTTSQSNNQVPVTSNYYAQKGQLSAAAIQTTPEARSTSLYGTMNQWRQRGMSSPTGSQWNLKSQQQSGRHQFQKPANFWGLQSVSTGTEAGSQGFQQQSLPVTPSSGNPAFPIGHQSEQGHSMNSTWIMEPFRVLPSLEQPGQVQRQRHFGQPRSGNDEGSHYAHPSLTA
jgi:hypothetical protein